MATAKILLVDDDNAVRFSLSKVLEYHGFQVSTASNVPEALRLISSESFDMLLSDLHMPGAGDGLTVVSAMRHANPTAVTLLLSAFPQMKAAANAILLQADEILVKPIKIVDLLQVIEQRLERGAAHVRTVETVATILERTASTAIELWYSRVQLDPKLAGIPLSHQERCEHLPLVFHDLVKRLRASKSLGSKELISNAAIAHGALRCQQGYTAALLVEESRILQVSIFETLQNNLANIDFSILLTEVMTIADEVDSQLAQAMESFSGSTRIGIRVGV